MKKSTMEFMNIMTIVFAMHVQIEAKTRTEFLSLLRAGKAEVADRLPPNYNYDEPSVVACYVDVNQVDTIRESNMDFTVDIGLHLSWKNKELGRTMDTGQFQFEYVDFDAQNMEKVWVPDIYFPNEKKAAIHNIMMANKMLRLYRNSTISYTIRVLLTLSCNMDLRKYPFDKQVCSILIESFGYTADKLVLVWDTNDNNPSPVMTENIELRQFRMVNIEYHNYTRTHSITGDHSCLQADFHLVRNIGYYVIQMYVPSLLIVMLSWLSFWLNVNSIPGRVTLGVLSVLTLSTQSSGVNASLPRVSYTKAIDVWMATCLVFAFAALIEFAVVNVLSQKVPGRRFSLATLFQVTKDGVDEKDTSVDQDGKVSIEGRNPPKSKVLLCSEYLDNASRFMFPLAFGIFNMIYWIYYLNVTEY